mmetsp:Transcript_48997/g.106701  ORF Transcript_48997/g.106701 Transcript_48997/m.106701 type:complete len:294 (+) Transcript_48997:29-910(+)
MAEPNPSPSRRKPPTLTAPSAFDESATAAEVAVNAGRPATSLAAFGREQDADGNVADDRYPIKNTFIHFAEPPQTPVVALQAAEAVRPVVLPTTPEPSATTLRLECLLSSSPRGSPASRLPLDTPSSGKVRLPNGLEVAPLFAADHDADTGGDDGVGALDPQVWQLVQLNAMTQLAQSRQLLSPAGSIPPLPAASPSSGMPSGTHATRVAEPLGYGLCLGSPSLKLQSHLLEAQKQQLHAQMQLQQLHQLEQLQQLQQLEQLQQLQVLQQLQQLEQLQHLEQMSMGSPHGGAT